MNILKIAINGLVGMFIDDGALALLALALIIAVGCSVKWGLLGGSIAAGILIVGCLLILAESVARAARRKFMHR
jgi:tetrahydromethanopterin S-methyltransferase subunit E